MVWSLEKLQTLCEVFTDGDWIESKHQSTEGVRLIQTGNVGVGKFKNRRDKARFISIDTFQQLKCCEIHEGDCLVSRLPDPVGRSCLLPNTGEKMITAVDCTILRFNKDKIIPEYFNFFSQSSSYLIEVESLTSGATRKRISRKNLGLVEIPLPPIPEQKRIVALLDTVFADLEQTRAKTEQNLKNACELFDSYLQQVFSQKGEGWESILLGEIADLVDSLHTTPKYINEGGFPMVRVTEIKKSGLSLKKAKRVDQETYEKFSKRHKSSVGDIILSRVGASYGIPVIVEMDEVFCLDQNTVLILPKINSYWLYYFLLSPVAKEQIDSFVAGSAQPTVSMKSIRQLIVPIPSKLEQDRIEPEIKKVLSQSNQLIEIYTKKLEAIDELKKSILQKAFSGELTAEDK